MKYTINQSREETIDQLIADANLGFDDESTVRAALDIDLDQAEEIESIEEQLTDVEDTLSEAKQILQSTLSNIEHIIAESEFNDENDDYKISESVGDDLREIETEINDFV